jgi:ribosomal RNA-processing protein 7
MSADHFYTLNVYLPETPKVKQPLFIRKHQPLQEHQQYEQNVLLPDGRTLFVVQFPLCSSERDVVKNLTRLFKPCGDIERVCLKQLRGSKNAGMLLLSKAAADEDDNDDDDADDDHDLSPIVTGALIRPGTAAYVIFSHQTSLKKAMKLVKDASSGKSKFQWRLEGGGGGGGGFERYLRQYRSARPKDRSAYRRQVEAAIAEYDRQEEQRRQEELRKLNQPDEDGWVTVTRASRRNTNTDGKGVVVTSAKPEDVASLTPGSRTFQDFYKFQRQREKVDKYQQLKQKFEEDKKRLAAMKAARKFNPF